MEKRLEEILRLSDEAIRLYDLVRINNNFETITHKDFQLAKQHRDYFIQLISESIAGYMPVITTEDCIVNPGETVEVKTNIYEFPIQSCGENKMLEFTHKGIISTYGQLSFYLEKDYENGNKIMVTNNVPKNYVGHGSYENTTSTYYFSSGIYPINKYRMIGIIGFDPEMIVGYNPLLQEEEIKRTKKLFLEHIGDIDR